MVVVVVKLVELLEGKVGDLEGVSSRVGGVGVVGESGLLRGAVEKRVWGGVDPLHLVEDHPLVGERRVLGLELIVPALLRENVPARREGGGVGRGEVGCGAVGGEDVPVALGARARRGCIL